MSDVKYFAAVQQALQAEMRRDPTTVVLGEDVGTPGGIFAQTRGLLDEFGPGRVLDAPAGELGYVGAAVGMALTGLRPIAEISFADFFATCWDQVVNQASKIRYMSGGQVSVPLTLTAFGGGGLNAGPQHSSSYEAWLGSVPGIKVATPASPADVYGLLRTAIRDDDPVAIVLHKGLLQQRGEVPDDEDFTVPLGSAAVVRDGEDVTVIAWSGAVRKALTAAETLSRDGISVEVIDLRSIEPLDVATLVASVRKTHRAVVTQETVGFSGVGAEIVAVLMTEAFDYLDAPVERVAAPLVPVPFSPPLEDRVIPQADDVVRRVKEVMS